MKKKILIICGIILGIAACVGLFFLLERFVITKSFEILIRLITGQMN